MATCGLWANIYRANTIKRKSATKTESEDGAAVEVLSLCSTETASGEVAEL